MAERIEFVGNPLPTGLPGFGGGTVSVLILPGFNTVVAVQQFGPVVDAPTVTPPDPEPPPGSNPENPTPNPVPPAPAPSPSGTSSNFCDKCKPPSASEPAGALLKAYHAPSSCRDCRGGQPGTIDWFRTAANNYNDGVFHIEGDNRSRLRGVGQGEEWNISSNPSVGLEIGNAGTADGCALRKDKVSVGTTEYRKEAKIFNGQDNKLYEPQDLEVCEGGETKTWKVLAWKP
jgi:hypothetical protein